MKILHVVPTYWPATRYGGPIYSVHGLCSALAAQDLDVTVFTTSVNGKNNSDVDHGKSYDKDGVEIVYFESKYLRRLYYSRALKLALSERIYDFDLIHLHSIFLYPTNVAARMAYSNQVPYVLSPRGMLEKSLISNKSRLAKQAWLKCVEQRTIENSALLHLTSTRELEELKKFSYAFPECVVIPNGVDNIDIENKKTVQKDQGVFQLLYLGRINWKKQIDHIIKALQYLDFQVKLTVAGNDEEGYKHSLDQLIKSLNLKKLSNLDIEFIGEVRGEQKKNVFIHSDVMILPSKSENFGNTVIEAMAHGCPVIVTPEVGASEVVKKAQAGLLTDGTPESIAECIKKLHNNTQMTKQMSTNAMREIQHHYLWPTVANQMIDAYCGVFSNHA